MKHIAVVGNIGSGKTSLTRMLAQHFGWRAEFESVDNNPYLEDFYADMPAWAFHLQIYFLNSRFQQMRSIQQLPESVVQDRTIYEDAHIFARNLHLSKILSERDYANYKAIYDSIIDTVTPPDLLVYLRADLPKLQAQIRKRARDFESNIAPEYLESLNKLYEDWIREYEHSKVLIFDMNHMDFVNRPHDFSHIVEAIEREKLVYG